MALPRGTTLPSPAAILGDYESLTRVSPARGPVAAKPIASVLNSKAASGSAATAGADQRHGEPQAAHRLPPREFSYSASNASAMALSSSASHRRPPSATRSPSPGPASSRTAASMLGLSMGAGDMRKALVSAPPIDAVPPRASSRLSSSGSLVAGLTRPLSSGTTASRSAISTTARTSVQHRTSAQAKVSTDAARLGEHRDAGRERQRSVEVLEREIAERKAIEKQQTEFRQRQLERAREEARRRDEAAKSMARALASQPSLAASSSSSSASSSSSSARAGPPNRADDGKSTERKREPPHSLATDAGFDAAEADAEAVSEGDDDERPLGALNASAALSVDARERRMPSASDVYNELESFETQLQQRHAAAAAAVSDASTRRTHTLRAHLRADGESVAAQPISSIKSLLQVVGDARPTLSGPTLSPHGSLRGSAASGRSSPSTPKSGRGLCSRGAAGDAASASERAVALASSASAQSLVDSVASGEGLRKSASTASLKKAEFPVPSRRTDGALRGLVGLRNLGNTCFMNSCLQALCSTPELIHFFESGSYRRDLNLCSTTRGRLAEAFGALISAMRRGEPHSVQVPLDVKNTVSIIAPRFSGFGQQDVQEFLQFLLDGLHDDLNRVQRKPKYEEIKDVAHEDDETKSQRWWKNYTDRNDSFVSQLFAGQLKSEVQCAACKHTSTAFDPFWDVSLPIPKRAQGGDSFYSSAPACSLLDCFVEFTRAEHLRGNEQVYCRSCKTHRDAIKVLSVYRYPHILVVTLKRFAAGAESRFSFSRQKLNTLVTFPVAGLDLSAFSPHTRHVPDAKGLVVYDLFAVANHSGSLGGGHYTAYARVAEDRWCCFNDSHCSEIDERTLQGSAAYVLFYRRR